LSIRDFFGRRVGIVRLEDQRDLVTVFVQMAVEAVDAGIELAVVEPADMEICRVIAHVLDPGRKAVPVQTLGLPRPECGRIAQ